MTDNPSAVRRYEWHVDHAADGPYSVESVSGEWVRYEDVAALLQAVSDPENQPNQFGIVRASDHDATVSALQQQLDAEREARVKAEGNERRYLWLRDAHPKPLPCSGSEKAGCEPYAVMELSGVHTSRIWLRGEGLDAAIDLAIQSAGQAGDGNGH